MAKLNYQTLCNIYTLEQIQEKVTFYMDALEGAVVREYSKDTSQGRQQVESEEMKNIESVLAVWMKALECKKGLGGVNIVSHSFGRGRC
jgi:hypothetical protein